MCHTVGGRQGGVGSAGLGRLLAWIPQGLWRSLCRRCRHGRHTAYGHWGGALDGNVDAGGRPWPWGGLGLSRGGVGERAAVQERVLRLEREKAMWRSF